MFVSRLTHVLFAAGSIVPLSHASPNQTQPAQSPAPTQTLNYPAAAWSGLVEGFDEESHRQYLAQKQVYREELTHLSAVTPFTDASIPPIDPISRKKVGHVLVGPTFQVRARGVDFEYYRYVTFYDVTERKERIYDLPSHREECHESNPLFASYNFTYTYSASTQISASHEGLGLSTSFTQTRAFTTGRQLLASGGLMAEHTPHFIKQDWNGRTFIQTYDAHTGKVAFLVKERKGSPWWMPYLFPLLAQKSYPMPFKVKDADWMFVVERTIISHCDGEAKN